MMIDSNMIEDMAGYDPMTLTTNSHWVVYEGGLKFLEVGDSKFVHFSIYTWDLILNMIIFPNQEIKKKYLHNTNSCIPPLARASRS
ncbi:hypothetical protein EV144_101434 [Flavobacterium sp. 270]|nr:hypothetical protein EV144_101434 [Flavobacterium sp. 270]